MPIEKWGICELQRKIWPSGPVGDIVIIKWRLFGFYSLVLSPPYERDLSIGHVLYAVWSSSNIAPPWPYHCIADQHSIFVSSSLHPFKKHIFRLPNATSIINFLVQMIISIQPSHMWQWRRWHGHKQSAEIFFWDETIDTRGEEEVEVNYYQTGIVYC